MKSWKARYQERKTTKKKLAKYEKELWEYFNKEMPFKKDLHLVGRCRHDLHKFIEDMKKKREENKVINNFLQDMSLGVVGHDV